MYLIAGLGKTGLSIARYLHSQRQSFAVFDTRQEPAGIGALQRDFPDVPLYLGEIPRNVIPTLAAIITSPGVPLDNASLQAARAANIPLCGDIECLVREVKAPIIAITGTNGKSTVTTLVGEMAKAAGINVAVGGNIGTPVLDLLLDGHAYDLWVLELSSFQLDLTSSLRPLASTILNITPDHLDRHHSLTAYIAAKQRVYHNTHLALYNREDELTQPLNMCSDISFGLDTPTTHQWGICQQNGQAYLAHGTYCLISVNDLHIKGRHNWANALAACALAQTAGISQAIMKQVLQTFAGLPHRCQWVRSLNGVEWINDSKGTNVGATLSAISGIGGSMQGKIVLIAGGQGKGADFRTLRTSMIDYVRSVVLMGEDAELMADALHDVVPVLRATSMDEAVQLAQSAALSGDIVLLSPACASLDMFRDFNHRGEVFTTLVQAL